MNEIIRLFAVLTLALAVLIGSNIRSRPAGDVNPSHVAETKQALRDLGAEDIFSVRHVVLNDATRTPGARDTSEQDDVVDTRQVARTMTELFSPLDFNYSAVKEYSEAAVAGKPMPCPFSLWFIAPIRVDSFASMLSPRSLPPSCWFDPMCFCLQHVKRS